MSQAEPSNQGPDVLMIGGISGPLEQGNPFLATRQSPMFLPSNMMQQVFNKALCLQLPTNATNTMQQQMTSGLFPNTAQGYSPPMQ